MTKRKRKDKTTKEEYSQLYDAWMDYSREMTDRIKELTKERAKEYEELYNMWNQYAKEMTEQVSGYTPKKGTSYKEMQRFFKEYSDDMGERFVEILGKENGPYTDLYKLWAEYSQKMGAQFSELLNESIKEQKDLYEIWMDTFGIKEKQKKSAFPADFGDISQFWLDMWDKSQNMYMPTGDSQKDVTQHLRDLNELWTRAYNKMVMEFIKSSSFAQLNGDILDTNLNLKQQNDEIVNRYLEAMGFPTKENINEIYLKLHEVDRKLAKISREMKNGRSLKRK